MPTTEDRIVQMRFENKDFDKNIEASKKSLEQFEKALTMNDGEKGLKNLNKALNDLDTTEATKGLQNVTEKLSALQTVASGALLSIGYKLENLLSTGLKSLTIDQLGAGWSKYASITSSTQTIMSATRTEFEDTGKQMEYVNEQLERLNTFTDETSYNLTEMTNNIGKFTSQGVKLDTAVTAMQGIATWAAMSGANSEAASRAMYNLSQALATGSVKLIDWRSIENANMATVEFKQTVLDTAASLGTLKKSTDGTYKTLDGATVSVSNFNAELQKGWFSSEVLLKSLDKYGGFSSRLTKYISALDITATQFLGMIDDLNAGILEQNDDYKELIETIPNLKKYIEDLASSEYELGRTAFKAAQEAKTFEEAINATKDAVSTGWMKTFQLVFGDYEKAKGLWTTVAEELYDLFAESANERNRVLQLWNQNYGYQDLMDGLKALWDFLKSIKDTIAEAWKEVFPDITAKDLIILTRRFKLWAESLKNNEGAFKTFASVTTVFAKALKLVFNVIKSLKFFIAPVWQQFKILIQNVSGFVRLVSDGASSMLGFENGLEALRLAFLALGAAVAFPLKLINAFIDWLRKIGDKTLPELQKDFDTFFKEKLPKAWEKFKNTFKSMGAEVSSGFAIGLLSGIRAIFDAAGAVFGGVITFAKDLFGIASPSRVFILIGGLLISGLAVGIMDPSVTKKVTNAIKTVFDSILSTLKQVIVKIMDTIVYILSYIYSSLSIVSALVMRILTLRLYAGITGIISNTSKIMRSFSILLKEFGYALEYKYRAVYVKELGNAIKGILIVLGIIIGLTIVLSRMDFSSLSNALKIIGGLIGIISGLFILITVLYKVIENGSSYVTRFVDIGSFGFLKKFGASFTSATKYSTTFSNALRSFTTSLFSIVISISILLNVASKALARMATAGFTITDFIALLTGLLSIIAGFMVISKKLGSKINVKSILSLSAKIAIISTSFVFLALALKSIPNIQSIETIAEKLVTTFASLALIIGGFYLLGKLESRVSLSKIISVLTKISLALGHLVLMSLALKIMANIDIEKTAENVLSVVGSLALIIGGFYLLGLLVGTLSMTLKDIIKIYAMTAAAVALVVSISVIFKALEALKIDPSSLSYLWTAVGVITVLVFLLSGISILMSALGGGISAAGVLAIGASILMLAYALNIVSRSLSVFSTGLISLTDSLIYLKQNIGDALLGGLALIGLAYELYLAFWLLGTASIPILAASLAIYALSVSIPLLISSCNVLAKSKDVLVEALTTIFNTFYDLWSEIAAMYPLTPVLTKLGLALLSVSAGLALFSLSLSLLDKNKEHFSSFIDFINGLDFGQTILGILKFIAVVFLLNLGLTIITPNLLLFSGAIIALSIGITLLSLAFLLAKTIAEPLVNLFANFSEITGESIGKAFMFTAAALGIALAFAFIGVGAVALGGGLLVLGIGVAALAGGFALLGLAMQLVIAALDDLKEKHEPIYNALVTFIEKLFEYASAVLNLLTTVVTFITDMFLAIKEFIGKAKDIAFSLLDGFLKGVEWFFSGQPYKDMLNFFKGIITDIKSIFGIHSPSTVMMAMGENVGGTFTDAVANSIDSGRDKVRRSINRLEEDIENGVERINLKTEGNFTSGDHGLGWERQRGKSTLIIQEQDESLLQPEKVDTLKEVGSAMGSAFKENWEKLKKGEITIGQALGNLFSTLKETGGEYLGNKIGDLKDSLLGNGGLLSGFKDLFGGKDLSKIFDPDELIKLDDLDKIINDATKNINLNDFAPIDTSALNGATAVGNQYTTSNYTFTQNNYSPKPLSRIELYRQTNRQFNNFKMREVLAK